MAQSPEHAGRRRRLDRKAAAEIMAKVRSDLLGTPPDLPPSDTAKSRKPAAGAFGMSRRFGAAAAEQAKAAKAARDYQRVPPSQALVRQPAPLARNWQILREIPVDIAVLERHLIITAARQDPIHGAFDVLRTRMLQAMASKGWRRVAVTSPTQGCGKSFTALNLAVALSRYQQQRTVLLDLNLRQPALAKRLGVANPGAIGDMLRGQIAPRDHLVRFGPNGFNMGGNVALGLNSRIEAYPSEMLLDSATDEAIAQIEADFAPDIMLFDMPPALVHDDAIALRRHVDCVLMVVGAGVTTPKSLRDAVRRLGEDKPILGMVLNKADQVDLSPYSY